MDQRHQLVVNKLGLAKDHPMTEKVWSSIAYFLSGSNNDFSNINGGNSSLDIFSSLLSKRLKYDKGEKDMVAMHHEFGVEHKSGKKVSSHSITIINHFIDYIDRKR